MSFFPGLRDVLRIEKKGGKKKKMLRPLPFFRKKKVGLSDEIICSALKGGRQSRAALKALKRGGESAGTSKDPRTLV